MRNFCFIVSIFLNAIFRTEQTRTKGHAIEPIAGTSITSVDFDYESKSIYFVDTAGLNKGIARIVIGDSETKVIVKNNFGSFTIRSVTVDWVNCKYRPAFF